MRNPQTRFAYQPTLYRYERRRQVASLEFGTLFATSAEARFFATASYGWKSGHFTTCSIARRRVSAREYEQVVSRSLARTA